MIYTSTLKRNPDLHVCQNPIVFFLNQCNNIRFFLLKTNLRLIDTLPLCCWFETSMKSTTGITTRPENVLIADAGITGLSSASYLLEKYGIASTIVDRMVRLKSCHTSCFRHVSIGKTLFSLSFLTWSGYYCSGCLGQGSGLSGVGLERWNAHGSVDTTILCLASAIGWSLWCRIDTIPSRSVLVGPDCGSATTGAAPQKKQGQKTESINLSGRRGMGHSERHESKWRHGKRGKCSASHAQATVWEYMKGLWKPRMFTSQGQSYRIRCRRTRQARGHGLGGGRRRWSNFARNPCRCTIVRLRSLDGRYHVWHQGTFTCFGHTKGVETKRLFLFWGFWGLWSLCETQCHRLLFRFSRRHGESDRIAWTRTSGTRQSRSPSGGRSKLLGYHGKFEIQQRQQGRGPPVLVEPPLAQNACYQPVTDDFLPIIGALKRRASGCDEGCYMAGGNNCWGILLGPATGECMADLIATGKTSHVDIRSFRPSRYRNLKPVTD